jgi:hypothetical protein
MHAKRHSFPGFEAALSRFQAEYPDYSKTAILGSLRARYYRYLDSEGLVYLDYAGGGPCVSVARIGEEQLRRIGPEMIQQRVFILTSWLRKSLLALRHDNSRPLARFQGGGEASMRDGILTMDFLDPDETPFDMRRVGRLASESNICMRALCFRDSNGADSGGEATAACVSLGLVSNFNDVYRFYEFARRFVNVRAGAI